MTRESIDRSIREGRRKLTELGLRRITATPLEFGVFNTVEMWVGSGGVRGLLFYYVYNTRDGSWEILAPVNQTNDEDATWKSLTALVKGA